MQLYVSHQFLQLRSGRIRSSGPQTASDDGTHAAKRTRSDPNLSTTHLNLVCWFCPGLGPVLVYLFRSERHHPTWPDEGVMFWLTWFCLHTQLEIVPTSCQKHPVVSSLQMSQHTFPPASWHGSQLTHMQRERNMTQTEMLIFDMIIYDTNLNARGFIQATSEESDIELKHDLNWMSMSFCVCWMYKYETVCWTWKCETITHVSLSQNTFRHVEKRSSVDAVRWRCVAGVCWTVLLSSDAFKEKSIHAICERGDVRSHFKTQWRHLKPL